MTNHILSNLSEECRAFLQPRLLTKPIHAGEVLYVADSPAQSVIFPHDGVISLQCRLSDGRMVERMQVGRAGAVGLESYFGLERLRCYAIVVVSGSASWLPASDFREANRAYPDVSLAMLGHLGSSMNRVMQAVVCASVHPASQRIANWLLQADDQTLSNHFDITQRSLADVLGLRLATVSEACSKLMQSGAIRYSRGSLTIEDRDLLLGQSCECYEASRFELGHIAT